jgi:hypothetical protein
LLPIREDECSRSNDHRAKILSCSDPESEKEIRKSEANGDKSRKSGSDLVPVANQI